MHANKVLLIGLDAATFYFIRQWKEMLPNINSLISKGVSSELISTIPALTPPAWTSIVTGKNPGKHGVFHFFDASDQNFVNSTSKKANPIWDILSNRGKKVILVNVPMTYPPSRVNGLMISGFLTPDEKHDFTYPKELKKAVLEMGYEIFADAVFAGIERLETTELKKSVKSRSEVTLWLLKHYPWDFAALVFMETDLAQHFYFKNPPFILEIYLEIDRAIGTLLREVPRHTSVVLVSDHGFGPRRKTVAINAYLYQLGLIRIKPLRLIGKKLLNKFLNFVFDHMDGMRVPFSLVLKKLHSVFNRLGGASTSILIGVASEFFEAMTVSLARKTPLEFILKDFDLSETEAYYPFASFDETNCAFLRIGPKCRRSQAWLVGKLYDLTDPETGEKIVKKACWKDEVYWGKYTAFAPDLILELDEEYSGNYAFTPGTLIKKANDGMHHREGIAMFKGPNIKRGYSLSSGVSAWDIAPTILQIMKVPVPSDMDGKVITEIFRRSSEVKIEQVCGEEGTEAYRWKTEEEEEIRKRLRALGYLQ